MGEIIEVCFSKPNIQDCGIQACRDKREELAVEYKLRKTLKNKRRIAFKVCALEYETDIKESSEEHETRIEANILTLGIEYGDGLLDLCVEPWLYGYTRK